MARNKLSPSRIAAEFAKARQTGKTVIKNDGGGLYLFIRNGGRAASWMFRYRGHWMGLGSYDTWSLDEVRQKAVDHRKMVDGGIDPIKEREETRRKNEREASRKKTLKEVGDEWLESSAPGWGGKTQGGTGARTRRQLENHLYPKIGHLPIQEIDEAIVTDFLKPFWVKRKGTGRYSGAAIATGRKLRQQLESIFGFAKVRRYFHGGNPAAWK